LIDIRRDAYQGAIRYHVYRGGQHRRRSCFIGLRLYKCGGLISACRLHGPYAMLIMVDHGLEIVAPISL